MSKRQARTLVFFTSAAVLVMEILAGRLMAPYLGISLEVFTGIIGVILAGISIGAWLGGRAADRVDPQRLVGPLLAAGGLFAILSPTIVDFVGPRLGLGPASIISITALGFFLPSALLSAVPPVVVKLRLASLQETGSVVGSYSAIGTAGAILGTFLTGFFLIAAFPTRPIVAGVGFLLMLWGALLIVTRNRTIAAAVVVLGLASSWLLAIAEGPCQYETPYHCAEVVVDPSNPTGRTLVLDTGSNSYIDLADPGHLEFRYAKVMADVIVAGLPPGALSVLSIGGGGFTFPVYLDEIRPGTQHTVLEIDPSLLDIARSDLGYQDQASVVIGDARRSMNSVPDASADLVIGDAFSGFSVPWHLTTVEFVEAVHSKMRPGGIYVINVIDYNDVEFPRSTAATFGAVFDQVAVIAPPAYLASDAGGNFVVVGSDAPLDASAISEAINSRNGAEVVVVGSDLEAFVDGAMVLRDDFAPVDQMIDLP